MTANLSTILADEWKLLPLELVQEVLSFIDTLELAHPDITTLMQQHCRIIKRIDNVVIIGSWEFIEAVDLQNPKNHMSIINHPVSVTFDHESITVEELPTYENKFYAVRLFWPKSCTSVRDCVKQMGDSYRVVEKPIADYPEAVYVTGTRTIDLPNSIDTVITKTIDVARWNHYYLTLDKDIVVINGEKTGLYL